MSILKRRILSVAGALAQPKCRETLAHPQSYSQHLHQHPLPTAGAIPSPSLPHNHTVCACSGSSLGPWVPPRVTVTHFPPTLKIYVMAQKLSFIHTTWISHHCAEWIWLQSGGSKFGLLHSLIEERYRNEARDTEMRNWMSFIISFLSPCFSCCLSPLFAGILSSSLE